MKYDIYLTEVAKEDIQRIKSSGDKKLLKKLNQLLNEIRENPYSGTGKVEQLKYYEIPTFSRRINKEHRLVYRINEDKVIVIILSSYGHY